REEALAAFRCYWARSSVVPQATAIAPPGRRGTSLSLLPFSPYGRPPDDRSRGRQETKLEQDQLSNFITYSEPDLTRSATLSVISAPNEFDVMFILEVPRIELVEYSNSGAYYFVKFKRNPKENPLNRFVENELLSASKMLLKFREIIKEEIKNITDIKVVMERKKPRSPAVTLLIKEPEEISVDIILALELRSSWPLKTTEGLPIKDWLGGKVRTELRRKPFYLIPKNAKEGQSFQEETWRLSFSHIEKDILNNHGDSKKCCETDGMKCCRKDCLKLMKYLLEQLKKKFEKRKELSEFCSYHVKTAFFHLCVKYPKDSYWNPEDIHLCFDECVAFFLERLRKEELQHFFIPGVNLFSQEYIDTKSKIFLAKQIEYERNNQFPIFSEF
uniref:Uncharacterized protein n=1 Tax=Cavia porcellus TaxID=10141 RepID=H0VH90_CAVPO